MPPIEAASGSLRSRLPAGWPLLAGCWLVVALLLASPPVLNQLIQGNPLPWRSVGHWLAYVCLWALLTPRLFRLSRRFPLHGRAWRRNLCVHVAAACAVLLVDRLFVFAVAQLFGTVRWPDPPPASEAEKFVRIFVAGLPLATLNYWIVVGVGHAVVYHRLLSARELEASKLEVRLTRTRLEALKLQVQPRFMLDTLRMLERLVEEDPKGADRVIARMSDLLRIALENDGRQEVSLREELEFLDPYLTIEEARRGGRLDVRHDVDSEALDVSVPTQILQPVVEAAIRSGMPAGEETGWLTIAARARVDAVRVEVRAGGPRLLSDEANDAGLTGGEDLDGTRARLFQLYGPGHSIERRPLAGGGVELAIMIPWGRDRDSKLSSSYVPTLQPGRVEP